MSDLPEFSGFHNYGFVLGIIKHQHFWDMQSCGGLFIIRYHCQTFWDQTCIKIQNLGTLAYNVFVCVSSDYQDK
jgi:hypothetical protein